MLKNIRVVDLIRIVMLSMIIIPGGLFAGNKDSTVDPKTIKKNNPLSLFKSQATPINSFPSPDGATRGLTFDGTYLWAADNGDGDSQFGKMIYKLDPNTGAVINSYTPPGVFPNGMAWDGEYLWHSDHGTGLIYKLNPTTITVVDSFDAPGTPYDLAWHDGYLYAVRGGSTIISKIDPNTGSEVAQIQGTYDGAGRPFGLTALPDGQTGKLLAADDDNETINEYNFTTTTWTNQLTSLPAIYPCGLAYDSQSGNLWVSCWSTDSIYVFSNITGIESDPQLTPKEYVLSQNYPNPFNPTTTIEYEIAKPAKVILKVFDMHGREVATLVDENLAAGPYQTRWDARGQSSGVYFYKVQAGEFHEIRKMMLLK